MAAMGDDDMITLVSQEGKSYEIPRSVGNMSVLISTMTEDGDEDEEVPLMEVKSDILEKVIEYMTHYQTDKPSEIEKPLKSSNLASVVGEWDAHFVDLPQETLFELILAANYMDIKPLLDLACAKVASMIKGKKPEEIRKTFNIVNDFTPEEERQVREENKWAEDA